MLWKDLDLSLFPLWIVWSGHVSSKSHAPDEPLCASLGVGAPVPARWAVLRTTHRDGCESRRSRLRLVFAIGSAGVLRFPACLWGFVGGLANRIFFKGHLWTPSAFVESLLGTRHSPKVPWVERRGARKSGSPGARVLGQGLRAVCRATDAMEKNTGSRGQGSECVWGGGRPGQRLAGSDSVMRRHLSRDLTKSGGTRGEFGL